MERALMAVADGINPYKRRRVDPALPGTATNPLFPPVAFDQLGMGGGRRGEDDGSDVGEEEESDAGAAVNGQGGDALMATENGSPTNVAAGAAAQQAADAEDAELDQGEDEELKGAEAPRAALASASPSSSRSSSPPSCAIGSVTGVSTMTASMVMSTGNHRQHGGRRTPEAQGHRQPLSSPSSAARSRRNLAKASR